MATEERVEQTPQDTDQVKTLIEATREQFEEQMEALRPGHEAFLRLEQILSNFDKVVTGPARKGRGGSRHQISRPDEFLRLVTESGTEGITVSEAATAMDGMNPNYLYRIAKDLIADEKIVKGVEDKRYRAA